MAGLDHLLREKSVQLCFDSVEGSSQVFTVLKDCGIDPTLHLTAVQNLPGKLWDITFKSVELKKRFWPSLSSGNGYTVTSYTSSATVVNVLHVPFEVEDNVVRFVLGRYGKVVCGRFLTLSDYPTVYNGIRQYQIEIKDHIPSSLRLGGRNCWVRYWGQPRTCMKCGVIGHEAKECNLPKCFKCQGLGHTSKTCVEDDGCTTCDKSGHTFRNCPVSFSSKFKQSTAWVAGEASPVKIDSSDTNLLDMEGVEMSEQGSQLDVENSDGVELESISQPEVIPDTQDPSVMDTASEVNSQEDLFEGEAAAELLAAAPKNWAEVTEDSQMKSVNVIKEKEKTKINEKDSLVPEKAQSQPSPLKDQDPSKSSKRKSVSPPTPTKRVGRTRSRSSTRFLTEDPKDTVKMTQIFIEEEPWHSCYAKDCKEVFSKYTLLKEHTQFFHPDLKPRSYSCLLKSCRAEYTTPQDWIWHVACEHPDFVEKHEVEFFDRTLHPNTPGHTWARGDRSSRLDRLYLPTNFAVTKVDTVFLPFSDHDPVYVKFSLNNTPRKGKGYWKYNSSISHDEDFVHDLRYQYKLWSTLKPAFGSITDWWENVKSRIKELAIRHGIRIAQDKRHRIFSEQCGCNEFIQDEFVKCLSKSLSDDDKNS
ncbi:Zinc finger CCHC domain-containing protein 3 [Holothuria leucospilota]|uniref:Zinc finger CCHC domain-containing protein 3 n=1 Tax=Holothuria leucospilota TaxID=206669 RepID=A0A9Q0YIP4_HOLLE|nr:Zinc finger CCHC domain-containing protein 3 [Holothuria leucospilota]